MYFRMDFIKIPRVAMILPFSLLINHIETKLNAAAHADLVEIYRIFL